MKRKTVRYRNRPQVREGINLRLALVTIFLLAGFGLLAGKLVMVQVVQHSYYLQEAKKNVENQRIVPARRGTILDRKGRELARDVIQYSVGLNPLLTTNPRQLAREVAGAMRLPETQILQFIRNNNKFAYLDRRVDAETGNRLKKIKNPGLILERRLMRVYPYKENAAHLLGYCDVDNNPLGGIEYQYNHFLQGKPGWKIYLKDALGNQFPSLNYAGEDPVDGLDIKLTIDVDYQIILEDELKSGVESNSAREGVALLMDPRNGEILAMANYPQFDPNHPGKFSAEARKNRAIGDVVEPGSTFKFVTFAAVLENLNLNVDKEIVFCENGRLQLYDQNIIDHKKYGWLTVRKVFENSSNIGTMKLVEKLAKRVVFNYSRNFGFGMISGIDLPGESAGILHPLNSFTGTTHYYMSIGYEVGVTPIQLVTAYSAIANQGYLLKPYVMKSVSGPNGIPIREGKKGVIRQVIAPETSQRLTSLLVAAVNEGTGKLARLDGVTIAGKTGTAQLYNSSLGRHDKRKHLASFVGFFPAEQPRFALLVMIRQPGGSYYGGVVAAPVFRKMAQRILSMTPLDQRRYATADSGQELVADENMPSVVNQNANIAKSLLESRGYVVQFMGSGTTVDRQELVESDTPPDQVNLYLRNDPIQQPGKMPELEGLSVKESLRILAEYNLLASVEGHGIVVRQYPRPGAKLNPEKIVKLVCKPS